LCLSALTKDNYMVVSELNLPRGDVLDR